MAAKYAALNAKVEYIAWVEEELIPLLIDAYGKPVRYWRQAAKNAEQSVGKLPVYEDFDSTVERIRLLLVNKDVLTRAEIKDFGWLRTKWPWCVGIFVRHALNHGPYLLASLGKEPNPDHVRQKVKKPEDQDIYVYCGRLAVDDEVRPEDSFKNQKQKRVRKPCWRQGDKQSDHDASEPPKPQDDEQNVRNVCEPREPNLPQKDIQGHSVVEALSKKELNPSLEPLGVEGEEGRPASELDSDLPLPVHQLPPRPKFGNHGLIGPAKLKQKAAPRAYPQWGTKPMLKYREQSPYIPNQNGFPNGFPSGVIGQPHIYSNIPSNGMVQGGFPTPPYQPGSVGQPYQYHSMPPHALGNHRFPPPYQYDAHGQPYREYGNEIPAPHQVHGSFHAPYQSSTPVLPGPSLAFQDQGMPSESSKHHLRFDADDFVPESQGLRF